MSAPAYIPLSRPCLGPKEEAAALRALRGGQLVGRGGIGVSLEGVMAKDLKSRHALLTTSGTHALELAMAVLRLGPGDEVILPSFTFSSVANAVLRQRAKPVFAEVTWGTLNLDPKDVERRITKKTKAIVPVHYAGVACDMDALGALARRHKLAIVEDAAHGVGASFRGQALGTLGDAGCYSFHSTKNITCGEGGAFLTGSDKLGRAAEFFREKGTNRSAFIRGEVNKYTWVSEGSSYVLSDLLTAVLHEQWLRRDALNSARGVLYRLYLQRLKPLADKGLLTLPIIPKDCASNYHLFHILLKDKRRRDALMDALKKKGIGAAFHYIPLHSSPFGRKVLGCKDSLPVTDSAAERLLRLPLYPDLRKNDVLRVCDELEKALA